MATSVSGRDASTLRAIEVAIAGLLANGLNLIVTIVLARVLPKADHSAAYGAFAQMVGLFIVVSLPGSAIAIAVVRRSSWWLARDGQLELEAWRRRVARRAGIGVALFTLVAIALCVPVASLLGGRSAIAVAVTSVGAACWVAISIERSFLQATRSYRPLAANLLVEGLLRTVFVLAGAAVLGVTGAVIGILVCELLTWAMAGVLASRCVPDSTRSAPGTPPARELGVDLVAAIIAFAMLALLQYVDVFVVGRENSTGSGPYAAIAVVAKTLVYVAIVLSYYLLPEASLGHRAGSGATRQLGTVLALYAIPCAGLFALSAIAPRTLLSIVYPARLLGAAHALPVLVAAMALLGLSMLLGTYLLARGGRWVAAWLVLGGVVSVVLVAQGGGAWQATATRDLAAQAIVAAGLIAGTTLSLRASRRG